MGKLILFQTRRSRKGRPHRPPTSTILLIVIIGLVIAVAIAGYLRLASIGPRTTPLVTESGPAASLLIGTASVIDGDTIRIGHDHIRLFGIDAPEHDQTCSIQGKPWECGTASTQALAQKLAHKTIECQTRGHDQYGRDIAKCRVDGEDVGAWLVAKGWAIAYRYYSLDYVRQEQDASASKLGMWQGEFVPPWEWRRGNRRSSPISQQGSSQPIQGSRERPSFVYQRFGDSKITRYESLSDCSKAREQDGGNGACILK